MMVGAAALTGLTSCNGWLGEPSPGVQNFDDFFINGSVCIQTVNAAYAPLAWDFNNSYFDEWYIGDIASDDALKGGQNLADGPNAYDIDNFKVNPNNGILLDYYRCKFMGIARCNLAIDQLPGMVGKLAEDDPVTEERLQCAIGEAHFMRAMYYFQLVRVFGRVPKIDFVVSDSGLWKQPCATTQEIYDFIIKDLLKAHDLLWEKSQYPDTDAGRATKGAAKAYLCKAYLYMKDYDNAYKWGKDWVDNEYKKGEYALSSDYFKNFTLAGENDKESVFEIQYMEDPTSSYGGFGFSRGSFSMRLTRPRASQLGAVGWGWNHPTQELWDAYEAGDPRREQTIGVLAPEDQENSEAVYLGNIYYSRKTCWIEDGVFPELKHDSRGPLNYKLMRASDALLLYAEAANESGKDMAGAKWALEQVRSRARAQVNTPVLPEFPGYNGYTDNAESLRQAIRHERRVELGMEAHRWFDIVRWGIAADVMNNYRKTTSAEVREQMAEFLPGKCELFPLPAEEINLNPLMTQNPGY